jgi:hypothetical protein
MPHITLANATGLDLWAQRLDARSQLPRVLRRLVAATAVDLQHVDFLADESVQLSGWDGLVHTGASSAFVPVGISVWEIGVDKAIKGKADDDYEKRSKTHSASPRPIPFIRLSHHDVGGANRRGLGAAMPKAHGVRSVLLMRKT